MLIQNSSVSNLNIGFSDSRVTNVAVGGIIGYIHSYGGVEAYITNNYVYGLQIEADVTSTLGVGGILGYKTHSTDEALKPGKPYYYIYNCYTTGKINTKVYAGGILGHAHWANCFVEKCFSLVNINSTTNSGAVYIGGIAGFNYGGASHIKNNISLGNTYVAGNNVTDLNRILGNSSDTDSFSNYAYKDQLVGGNVQTANLGATGLITTTQVFEKNTYTELLKFDNNWRFFINRNGEQYNLLENLYLPQLNDTNGEVLANQKLIALNTLKLSGIESHLSNDKTEATVKLKFENPNHFELTKVEIENDDMSIKTGTWNTYEENGLSIVEFVAIPNKAFDSYKIKSIFYIDRNGNEEVFDLSTKIKLELFKGISNAKEWNDFFASDYDEETGNGAGRKYPGQNIKILGNINFSEVSKVEDGVIVGRLEADQTYTFSNINLTYKANSKAFISEIKNSLNKLNFENCNITGRNYNGIIGILRGAASNCEFNNIVINCKGYSYIGVISRTISGSFNNIKLNKITCLGARYVGGLCGQTTSLGASSDIIGEYINVTATGTYSGGIFGSAQGNITNIEAYQYSKDGKKAEDEETNYLVKGTQRVGGVVGQYNSNKLINAKTTNSKIEGVSHVGGNIGGTSGNVDDMESSNNTIIGTEDYIGGNVGYKSWYTYNGLKSENNNISGNNCVGGNIGNVRASPVNNAIAINNTVTGTNYVAGSIGRISYANVITNIKVSGANTQITGASYIGGAVGGTTPDANSPAGARMRNIKVEDALITGSGTNVGGIVGSNEYSNPSISATSNGNYSIAGAYAVNLVIRGTSNVGGIAGYENGYVYGAVSENNNIIATDSNAGGILGYYVGYVGNSASSLQSTNYSLIHSFCKNCDIIANSQYAGGLVGYFIFGNIQYCYMQNSNITAGYVGAGGLIGYLDNSNLNDKQYKTYIKYNMVCNTEESKIISSTNSVGGLIGETAKKLNYDEDIDSYNNIECNLVITDIVSTGQFKDIGIGSVAGLFWGNTQSKYMNKIYTYNCSTINGKQIGGILEMVEGYNMVTSTQLKDISAQSIYKKNNALNFGTTRYDYKAEYFPNLKIKYSNAQSYWSSNTNYLNIQQQWLRIPSREEQFDSSNLQPMRNLMSLSTRPRNLSMSSRSISINNTLPKLEVYSVDIDKINVEFNNLNGGEYFSIVLEDGTTVVQKQSVTERVYSFKYDFKTPFEIVLGNTTSFEKYQFEPKDLQNILSIVDDEYLYISETEIISNKRKIEGEFVNLYDDKIMDTNGNIYELRTMKLLKNNNSKMSLQDEITPIAEANCEGKTIQTFYHSSKIMEGEKNYTYRDGQIFVKNGIMYLVDANFENVGKSIIVDSYNNNQYETILGTDGILYDLLSKIKYPEGFENENIIAMTNNIKCEDNTVLIYYSYGKVYGFNYITGEEVYDNHVEKEKESLFEFITNKLNPNNVLYELNQSDYNVAQELEKKLEKVPIEDATKEFDLNLENVGGKQNEINENDTDKTLENIIDNIIVDNSKSSTTKSNTTITNNDYKPDTIEKDNNQIKNSYITTYDPIEKSYVVYSTKELVNLQAPRIISESEKINQNEDLKKYYENISEGKMEIKNIGVTVIIFILLLIILNTLIMYRKGTKWLGKRSR